MIIKRSKVKHFVKYFLINLNSFLLFSFLISVTDAHAIKPTKKAINKKLPTSTQPITESTTPCKASLLIEAETGDIIHELNAHEPLPPASMIKLMLAYVVMKKVKDESVNFSDIITTSASASKIGGSQVYLKQGEQFSLKQLLEAVLVQSANDASVAIAEHIGGSTAGFVEMMNIEAKNLGMNESEFHSPHGLPPGDGQQADVVSANDFATLSRAILRDFPELLNFTAKVSEPFRDGQFTMSNHNHLLKTFPGCDGFKTGYYQKAGFGVAATAQRNAQRMIAIVMGCQIRKERDKEAARLLSLGFSKYASVKLIDKGAPADEPVTVTNGLKAEVVPVAAKEFRGVIKTEDKSKIIQKKSLCGPLTAPIARDTVCGFISFMVGEREVGKVDLIIPEDIPALGIMGKLKRYIGL